MTDLADRARLPVTVQACSRRFPPEVETAAYFTACEGLTNALKHAGTRRIMTSLPVAESAEVNGSARARSGGHRASITLIVQVAGAVDDRVITFRVR